jgi:predicted DNA-binding transcriptional regulator AlpA
MGGAFCALLKLPRRPASFSVRHRRVERAVLQRILRLSELTGVTGLRRSALYAKIAEGTFPRPVRLGVRAVGWLQSDIEAWQDQRIALRHQVYVRVEVSPTNGKPGKSSAAPRTPPPSMSWQATSWARRRKTGSASAKCVLLLLAEHANEDGECWPSQRKLAEDSEQSVDTVQRRLRTLEEKGLIKKIERLRSGGRWVPLRYRLMVTDPPIAAAPRARQPNPRRTGPHGCGLTAPHCCGTEESIESIIESSPARPQRFASFVPTSGYSNKKVKPVGGGDRGAIKLQIAERIGPKGFDVLMSLPLSEVEALCTRQRRGSLGDDEIARLRIRAGEKVTSPRGSYRG